MKPEETGGAYSDTRGRVSRQRVEEVQKRQHTWYIKEEQGGQCGWRKRIEWGWVPIQGGYREPIQSQIVLGLPYRS